MLKTERQPQEIAEAIERGRCDLHDVLINSEVQLALHAQESHVRERATAYLLSSNFAYRVNGEPPLVNVNVSGNQPSLTIIEEVLPTSARALAIALADRNPTDPMAITHTDVRVATEAETSLDRAWGEK